ncbi:MAG: heavy-metal-associated domain-containing protein [Spirulinaceae cyanobacterium]
MQNEQFRLGGMGCAACAATIEQAIGGLPGVQDCTVNFAIARATVTRLRS